MNKKTRNEYNALAELGCILCWHLGNRGTPAEIHHIRRFGGKRDNAPAIPLCTEHHRGNTGVHGLGAKGFEKRYGIDQDFLLDLCAQKLTQMDESQSYQ